MSETQWLGELKTAVRDPQELLHRLQLNESDFSIDLSARKLFPLFVPENFIAKMEVGNPQDPLFLQVMCRHEEFLKVEGFTTDPLEEQHFPVANILHKYHNRVLFMLKNSCAINCRYCFRRHFPYENNPSNEQTWTQAVEYIAQRNEIEEVIFSGGDPLMAKDNEWERVLNKLSLIPHLQRIRIHSRLPVVMPSRITTKFCQLMSDFPLQKVLVTHINHSNEIDDQLAHAMKKLRSAEVSLLNQSVLLKGVNDDAKVLKILSDKLFAVGIQPYYLHLLDKVAGASHFYINDVRAVEIYHQLQAISSGFLVPKLAREVAGEQNKRLIV